jgi:cell division protein FtsB
MTEQNNGVPRFFRGTPVAKPILRKLPVIIFAAILVFAVWHLIVDRNGFLKYSKLKNELNDLTVELENLEAQKTKLTEDIEALNNDPSMLEKVAREKYRMHKPGEKVIEIVGDSEEDK